MKRPSKNSTKSKKTARNDYITFTGVSDEMGRMHFDFSGPQVLVNGKPATDVKLVRSYKREYKADKIISSISYHSHAPKTTGLMSQWSPDTALIDKFDLLIGIDTNTTLIDEIWVSATSAWITETEWKQKRKSATLTVNRLSRFIELHNQKPSDPEGRGWYSVINFGLESSNILEGSRSIGIIVDSKLGEHEDINARRSGYFSDFLLPAGLSLVYASDAVTDSIANLIIRQCDVSAREVLSSIKDGSTDIKSRWNPDAKSILMKVDDQEP